MKFAAVLAGGIGSRMGAEIPKQYIKVLDKPILVYTVEKFLKENFDYTIVLVPDDWVSYTEKIFDKYLNNYKNFKVISGGKTRNDTLENAVSFFEENFHIDEESIIVTHDGVRPFVTSEIIKENISSAIKFGAAGTMVPATDTIVKSEDGEFIGNIPNRKELFCCQTPQSFNIKLLKKMLVSLTDKEKETVTDGCKLFNLRGKPVKMVLGVPENIKITYPFDLTVAKAILGSEQKKYE